MEVNYPHNLVTPTVAFEYNQDLVNHLQNLYWEVVERKANLAFDPLNPQEFAKQFGECTGSQRMLEELLSNFHNPLEK